jgi:hypothetical protein
MKLSSGKIINDKKDTKNVAKKEYGESKLPIP